MFRLCGADSAAYEAADACTLEWWCSKGCGATMAELLGVPLLVYLFWAVPYFLVLFVLFPSCIERAGKETLFSFILEVPGMSGLLRWVPDKPAVAKPLAYQMGHLLVTAALAAPTILFWHSFWAHTLFVAGLLLAAVRNGSDWYFHYFVLRYAEDLLEENEAAPAADSKDLESDAAK